ncbi:hypothetical protein MATL_G00187960 [Megalops atlanticus]|uniref:Cilia- and flagella-associated protein 46 n=1 Tax=Megalops atlanticus TaxID=7932 RepID=A0A9D3SZV8_MEGAT|nr:hypothetical protein MATL_G00187960 [Megalops atlanticus]
MDFNIRQYLTRAASQKDMDALRKAYDMIKEGTKEKVDSSCFCPELHVLCAEQAFQLGCAEISENCLMMYFKAKPPANQFLSRAYLCQGQLSSPQTFETVEDIEKAVMHFLKAIEISKEQPRYHFLVFNASVLYFQLIRPFLRPGVRPSLVPALTQVVRALEEVGDTDYSWRAELMLHLVECLVEAGKVKEAASWAKVTSDFIEAHTPELFPRIFYLQVRHKLLDFSKIPKKTEESVVLSVIYKMQKLKYQVETGEARRDEGTKLREIFLLLINPAAPQPPSRAQDSSPGLAQRDSPVTPAERVAFLLELAHLALQLNQHQMTADCLRELKRVGVTDVGHFILVECLKCELDLHKRAAKITEYKKRDVEAQLKVVWKLDQLLQNALQGGGAGAVQGVCATQWNACLPLLQHNLRKSVRKPLLRLAQALEDTNSTLLELRCQVHSEVGVIEAEEDRLESAVEHLQKALRLDEAGVYRERLSTALHLLQLRSLLYETPQRREDQAALLIEQAKTVNSKSDMRKAHPMLVKAGVALAPDAFQVVLDADNTAKAPPDNSGKGVVNQPAARAQHHITCVQKADGHLKRQGVKNDRESVRLWAELVKTARRLEAWAVCRAACRFCVLHDDGRWKASNADREKKEGESAVEGHHRERRASAGRRSYSTEHDLLRLLAEVRFINAEATVHKLRSEGVQLNDAAVPPLRRGKQPAGGVSTQLEENPLWATYRDWVQNLSAYATSNFLRAAELGAELGEPWIVSNAAVYLWNYNSHILASGGQRRLLATFQTLIDLLKQTGHAGEDGERGQPPSRARKGAEKPGGAHGPLAEPGAAEDARKALELCEYALRLTNGNTSTDAVPIAARKQVIATWVRTKQLLQQQVGQKLDVEDESKSEEVTAMTRVLVGIEMLLCNSSSRLMEFSVPGVAVLVRMASDCRWTDPLVELQVWTHLAHFAHLAQEQQLVMTCSQNALQLEAIALNRVKVTSCTLYSYEQVQEMLSAVACLRGLALVQTSLGHPDHYTKALRTLQSSVSYAEKARSYSLCMVGAGHYWNTCLPLLEHPQEREQLQDSVEKILRAMMNTSTKDGKDEGKERPTKTTLATERSLGALMTGQEAAGEGGPEDDLTLRAAFYGLLFSIHADRGDWRTGLRVLDQAVREMPRTRHRLLLFKQRVVARARLGENIMMDMQKFGEEGEECLSRMWHRVARGSTDPAQKLACYQNAITSLQSPRSQWQKIEYLLEFGQWLYCTHFPMEDALHQMHWAEDILLHMEAEDQQGQMEAELIPVKCEPQIGMRGAVSTPSLCELRDVRRLEGLVRAHALLAAMLGGAGPQHRQHCLLAYSCVLRIWQVSLVTAGEVIREVTESVPLLPAQAPPSATSKKDRGKKSKEPPLIPSVEEKPKSKVPVDVLPTSPEEWALYDCPQEVRQAFRRDRNPYSINQQNIGRQTQALYFLDLLVKEMKSSGLTHLTLPVLHLAEVIAHDLMDSTSLSDLYCLRISRTCSQLGLSAPASYHEKRLSPAFICEEERMTCRKAIALLKQKGSSEMSPDSGWTDEAADYTEAVMDSISQAGRKLSGPCAQDIWLEKAEILLGMGQYQQARVLLAEAHLVAKELRDRFAEAKSLLLLAVLANQEQNHDQALALLGEAQSIGGDEDFWHRVTLCLVKATMGGAGQDKEAQACQMLEHTAAVLRSALEEKPNRRPVLRFLVAFLDTRRAVLQVQSLKLPASGVGLHGKSVKTLMAACDTLRQTANEFFQSGYQEEGAKALLEQAEVLRTLAKHTDNKEVKQRHLLDSYYLMHQAVNIEEEAVLTALSLLPPQETRTLSLPATRELACFRLALVGLALDMLEQVCVEEKEQALARDRKASAEKTVEDFVRSTPDPSSLRQEWLSTGRTLGQVVLTQLHTVFSLSTECAETRATSLCMMGKCLRLLAVQKDPLHLSTQWDIGARVMTPACAADPGTEEIEMEQKQCLHEEEERPVENNEPKVTEQRQSTSLSAELQVRRSTAQQLLAQASETLAQAVGLCLQHKLTPVLTEACLNMLECYGQFDPRAASQYLALYQSSRCCAVMGDVLRAACADSSVSQLSALLNLHTNLQAAKQEGEGAGSLLEATEHTLTHLSKAYTHLSINPNHLSILSELPSSFKLLLLQHSQDGSVLYGAFIEKAKPAESHRGKGTQLTGALVNSRVAKVSVCPETLSGLRDRARSFRRGTMQALIRDEIKRGGAGDAPWGDPVAGRRAATSLSENRVENEIASHFEAIVQEMEGYLHPLLSQLALSSLRLQSPTLSQADCTKPRDKEERSASDKELSPVDSGANVVLLVDRLLMELPLEALGVLQEEGVSSVSRDFSLQLLHSRLQKEDPVESDTRKELRGVKGGRARGDQSKAFKVVPVNRVLPPDSLPVDTHGFRYVIDPYNEAGENGWGSPVDGMRRILEAYGHQMTPFWDGVLGTENTPSLAELEHLLTNCSAFIFSGTERFLGNIPPSKIVSLKLSECQMVILFDLAQTSVSALRQSKLDVKKSVAQLALEGPLETAILLSLSGVRCIMLNQWHSTLQRNTRNMDALLESLLKVGMTSGQAIHALQRGGAQSSESEDGAGQVSVVGHRGSVLPRPPEVTEGNKCSDIQKRGTPPSVFNYIIYGLPNLVIT